MAEIRNLTPIDEMVRYFAVFEQCLRSIHHAGVRRNRSEMLLGGYLDEQGY